MTITTVEALVAHLKSEGVRFYVTTDQDVLPHWIRAIHRLSDDGRPCCPLTAALPLTHGHRSNSLANELAYREYGFPIDLGKRVMVAADYRDDEPAIRTLLLTLVEEP